MQTVHTRTTSNPLGSQMAANGGARDALARRRWTDLLMFSLIPLAKLSEDLRCALNNNITTRVSVNPSPQCVLDDKEVAFLYLATLITLVARSLTRVLRKMSPYGRTAKCFSLSSIPSWPPLQSVHVVD
jgi:hypothetical protein